MDDRSSRSRTFTGRALVSAVVVVLATGCAGVLGDDSDDLERGGDNTASRIKIAMVTHASPGDTFWDLVRKGAEAAADKGGVELLYSADPSGAQQAKLVKRAVRQKVDGIAVTLAKPRAMKAALAKARKAGIPVVGFNSGIDAWQSHELLQYFGQDEGVAGEALGQRLNALGAEHALCVVHEQGNVALEARCAGVRKALNSRTDNLYVNGANVRSVKATIAAKLRQHSSIDTVITNGAPSALTAVESVAEAESDAHVVTFDLNAKLVKAVRTGDVQLAVDQQPYLQGYLAVDSLWLYESNGNYSGGGIAPVLTGPAFVTKENVEDIARFAARGTR